MVNIYDKLSEIKKLFAPKIIADVNDTYVKLAVISGDKIPWHSHEHEDELFLILKGSLLMEEEGKECFIMEKGDLHVVKRGVRHRVSSEEKCSILLVENKSTEHTGNVKTDITMSIREQLE